MYKFFILIYKFRILILFLFLQVIAFIMRESKNKDYVIMSASSFFSYKIYNFTENFTSYLDLKKVNENLVIENTTLKNKLSYLERYTINDTISKFFYSENANNLYIFTFAKVINNSIIKEYNYITLNKGEKQGLKVGMAVLNFNGVVGLICRVSENNSLVMSLLNRDMKLSGKIKNKEYFGSINWDGKSYNHIFLNEITMPVNVNKGDTVVTSGFSTVFPKDINVGVIEDVKETKGSSFLTIKLTPCVDFKRLSYVYVVDNTAIEEQKKLEQNAAEIK